MPDTKLSDLPSGSPITAPDLFYSVQSGVSVKQTAATLSSFFGLPGQAPGPYTVATLPAGAGGQLAFVTDGASGQAWASIISGGGSARYLVWFNGANWTVVGDGGFAPAMGGSHYYLYGF